MELDNYQQWQLEKYNDVLPAPIIEPDGHTAATENELRRSAEWTELQAQIQLHDHE